METRLSFPDFIFHKILHRIKEELNRNLTEPSINSCEPILSESIQEIGGGRNGGGSIVILKPIRASLRSSDWIGKRSVRPVTYRCGLPMKNSEEAGREASSDGNKMAAPC